MSAKEGGAYDKLPELTKEEIHLASCPVVERGGKLIIIDKLRGLEIPLKKEVK